MSMKTLEGQFTVKDAKTGAVEAKRSEKLEDLNQSTRKYLTIPKVRRFKKYVYRVCIKEIFGI
jgi:polynucleotide 5'-kinase involved in rRNA processing